MLMAPKTYNEGRWTTRQYLPLLLQTNKRIRSVMLNQGLKALEDAQSKAVEWHMQVAQAALQVWKDNADASPQEVREALNASESVKQALQACPTGIPDCMLVPDAYRETTCRHPRPWNQCHLVGYNKGTVVWVLSDNWFNSGVFGYFSQQPQPNDVLLAQEGDMVVKNMSWYVSGDECVRGSDNVTLDRLDRDVKYLREKAQKAAQAGNNA